jgi:predicted ATPase
MRTDGIPLFVAEMTKAVLEVGVEDAAQRTAAAIPSSTLAVPASLQASLMARLDRLGPAREVAQIGAAVGREFSHALLAAVVGKPQAELQSALNRLISAGLLFRQGVAPHATYLFKHALVQDAAYGSLLREPRRALHAHIAEAIESQLADIAENRPELLARHCTEAGQIEKAVTLWGKAGQRSLEHSAFIEAVEHFRRALSQISTMPSTPVLRRQEIKLQAALITPLIQVNGYAASETKAAAERAHLLIEQAEALGEAPEDPLLSLEVLNVFAGINVVAFNGDAALALAAQLLALAEKRGTTVHLMRAHGAMGVSSYYGCILVLCRWLLKSSQASRSGNCPLRAHTVSFTVWPRLSSTCPSLSIAHKLGAWLPPGCARGCGTRAQLCAPNRSSCHADECAWRGNLYLCDVRKLRGSTSAPR